LTALVCGVGPAGAADKKPNFLIIWGDDVTCGAILRAFIAAIYSARFDRGGLSKIAHSPPL